METTPFGIAVTDGDVADGLDDGVSSRAFRDDGGGLANCKRDGDSVSVGVAIGDGFSVGVGVGVAVDFGDGVRLGDATGIGVGVGDGVSLGVGVGVAIGDGFGVGVGDGVGFGDGDGVRVGDGEGRSICGVSIGSVSVGSADCSLAFGVGVRAAPGSDQSPAFSPLTNVVCNRVWPCSLTTGPSNFPWTILPV